MRHQTPGYRSDIWTYFAAQAAKESAAHMRELDKFIRALDTIGWWAVADWLLPLGFGIQANALMNVKNPAKSMALANSLVWTAGQGTTGDGIGSYGDCLERPSGAGANNYSASGAMAAVWCRASTGGSGASTHLGTSSGGRLLMTARDTSGNETGSIFDTAAEATQSNPGTRTGFRMMVREGASIKRSYYNGVLKLDNTTAAGADGSGSMTLHRGISNYGTDQHCLLMSGGAVNGAQAAAIYVAAQTFLQNTGVI